MVLPPKIYRLFIIILIGSCDDRLDRSAVLFVENSLRAESRAVVRSHHPTPLPPDITRTQHPLTPQSSSPGDGRPQLES